MNKMIRFQLANTELVIDPPNGSRYGFPKPMPTGWVQKTDAEKRAWYIKEGYPAEVIDSYGTSVPSMLWHRTIED
jgi:hypothetical protein